MPGKSSWTPEAVRDLLLAMAMSDGSKKPTPNWGKVEAIMTEWGYGFNSSGISQHFNKKIWRDVVEKRGEITSTKPATPTTPKKRVRKAAKGPQTPADSDSDSDAPRKKRKASAKDIKEEEKNECV